MTLRTRATLPSNVVPLRRLTNRTPPSSTTLWEWLTVGLMFTACSFVAMYFLTHTLGMMALRHSLAVNSTSANNCSPTSCDTVPTNTSR
jgi:hypothetical protein